MSMEPTAVSEERTRAIFADRLQRIYRQTDRAFAVLLIGQWLLAMVLAVTVSPRTWVVDQSYWHIHLWCAVVLGGVLTVGPILSVWARPGELSTRILVGVAQVGYSTLLIHLTGGRIETHFHVFGSLAFLSFYRDWRVILPATLVVAADHLVRGIFWPESVFGVLTAAPWRAIEHAGWVLFEDVFLIWGCLTSVRELREMAAAQSALESSKKTVQMQVFERTKELASRTADLTSERRLLDAILQSVADGLVAVDRGGKLLCFNKGAEDLLGDETLEAIDARQWPIDLGLYEPTDGAPVPAEQSPLYRAAQGETIANRELILRRGEVERIVSVNASPLVSDSHCGGIASFRDVTEKTQLEEQLAEAQKLESIGQLAAGIAHEINTPMQYVRDNVEFLCDSARKLLEVVDIYQANLHEQDSPKPWQERLQEVEEAKERCQFDYIRQQVPLAIDETREGAMRVVEITQAMKLLSHPGREAKVSTNINEAIRSAATITKNRWKYAAEVSYDLAVDLPGVKTLTAEINQVLLNLIVNAADAIVEKHGENGLLGQITLRTYGDRDRVFIEVEDNGCGMPDEVRRRIFEPFFTTKDVGKGTGQGLAISYNVVVNHHGGQLEVETKPGEGTLFRIQLPLHPPPEPDATDDTPAWAEAPLQA